MSLQQMLEEVRVSLERLVENSGPSQIFWQYQLKMLGLIEHQQEKIDELQLSVDTLVETFE